MFFFGLVVAVIAVGSGACKESFFCFVFVFFVVVTVWFVIIIIVGSSVSKERVGCYFFIALFVYYYCSASSTC